MTGSQVGGSVQLEQGGGATVAGNRIDSDLQMESNSAALNAEGNDIGGNLQANQNTGGLAVVDNTIDGNLQCAANDPAPTGGGNVVFGSAEDQCAALTGDGPGTPSPDPTGTPSPGPTGTPSPDPTETARQTGRLSCPDRLATALPRATDSAPILTKNPIVSAFEYEHERQILKLFATPERRARAAASDR